MLAEKMNPLLMQQADRIRGSLMLDKEDDAARAAEELVESIRANGNGPKIEFVSGVALFESLPPTNWLCEGLEMAPGAPSIWAGFGHSGKTMAAQSLALSVASGRDVWNSFACRQGRVLHLDFEQGRTLTLKRYQKLALGMGVGPEDIGGRFTLAPLPRLSLGDVATERWLVQHTKDTALCIVDSFRAACPDIDENSSEARRPLDMLNRVSEATGCAFLVVHHSRKPSKDGGAGGARMEMRGSGALYDAAASLFMFGGEKGEPTRLQHEKARISGQLREDFAIEIRDLQDERGRFDGLEVAVTTLDSETTRGPSEQADRAMGAIRQALSAGPLGANQLEQACRNSGLEFNASAFRRTRDAMCEGGELDVEAGRNNSKLYRLAEGSK